MKFILNEPEDKEPTIRLRLKQVGNSIYLLGKDKDGEKNIMDFCAGNFCRRYSAHLKGLETGEDGRIIEKE